MLFETILRKQAAFAEQCRSTPILKLVEKDTMPAVQATAAAVKPATRPGRPQARKDGKKSRTCGIELSEELHEVLSVRAAQNGTSIRAEVLKILKAALLP